MTFNKYSLYSYAAGEFKTACDDKILVDLKRLDSLEDYDEIVNFVDNLFGKSEIDGTKWYDYPNNIEVVVERKEKFVAVGALKNDKQFFGRQWRLIN